MGRKAKYSKGLKLEIVKRYLKGESASALANEYALLKRGPHTIRDWVHKYESLGEKAFDNLSYNKSYSIELKLHVISDYLNGVTQLDMIIAKSKYRVLVYDRNQTVKGSDITNEQFEHSINSSSVSKFYLTTQMRCAGGTLYTDYIKNIFNCSQKELLDMDNYDFKMFDDV